MIHQEQTCGAYEGVFNDQSVNSDRLSVCIERGEDCTDFLVLNQPVHSAGAVCRPASDFKGYVYFIRDEIYTESI